MQEAALVGIGLLALVSRATAGTWYHPSCIYAAAWFVFLAIPMALGLNAAPLAAVTILLSVLGATLAAALHVPAGGTVPSRVTASTGAQRLVLAGTASAVVSAALTQHANGIPYSVWLHLDRLIAGAQAVTVLRYGGDLNTPPLATALLGITYAAAMVAPYAAASTTGRRSRLLLIAPTVGGGLYALGTTAKAGLIITAVLTVGHWTVVHAVGAGGRPAVNRRAFLGGVVSMALITAAFVYLTASRLGGWSPAVGHIVAAKASVYAGGGIPAFDAWASGVGPSHHAFGAQTFAGVSQFLLLNRSLGSAYPDFTQIGPGSSTNVYTILRPLTEDFGLAGAVAVLTLTALAAAAAFRRAVTKRSVGAAFFTGSWLGVILFGSATSVLSFTNVVAGMTFAGWMVLRGVRFHEPAAGTVAPATRPARAAAKPSLARR